MKIVDLNPVLFREYDLRGIVGDILNEDVAYTFGLNYGTYVQSLDTHVVVVGHDNRTSSPALVNALIKGITETGCNVVDLGLVTTPMFYFARIHLKLYAGVMVTASHNPKEYNGFKISFDKSGNAFGPKIQEFYQYTLDKKYASGEGTVTSYDISEDYLDYFTNSIHLKKNDLKVVLDCGNGTGSVIAMKALDRLGITYYPLFCDSDGNFPNHHPDPSVESNLELLKAKVTELGYDVGIALDGDADRIGVVSEKGQYVAPDLYLLFMATYLKDTLANKKVVFDVKCSRALIDGLKEAGLIPVMNRTGAAYMAKRMRDEDSLIGSECSGHTFYRDRWLGFDDGLYAGVRFIEMLADTKVKVSELLERVGTYYAISYDQFAGENGKREVVNKMVNYAHEKGYNSIELDGTRIEFEHSWALVRFSNTTPNLTIRFEADSKKELDYISNNIGELINKFVEEVKE